MSRSDYEDRAAKNRARYPEIYRAVEELRSIFGEDCKLVSGISIDGSRVGNELVPGWLDAQGKELESRQQKAAEVDRSDREGEQREGNGS